MIQGYNGPLVRILSGLQIVFFVSLECCLISLSVVRLVILDKYSCTNQL